MFLSSSEGWEWNLNNVAYNLWNETEKYIDVSSSKPCEEYKEASKTEAVTPKRETIGDEREKDLIKSFLK